MKDIILYPGPVLTVRRLQLQSGRLLRSLSSHDITFLFEELHRQNLGKKLYVQSLNTVCFVKKLPADFGAVDDCVMVFEHVDFGEYKKQFYNISNPKNYLGPRIVSALRYLIREQLGGKYEHEICSMLTAQLRQGKATLIQKSNATQKTSQ